jgi:hypothetical protein
LAHLVLEQANDLLDLVDLHVDGVRVPGSLSEGLKELDALHLGLGDQAHVIHPARDQLFLQLRCLLVELVDLAQIPLVVGLVSIANLSYLLAEGVHLLLLSGSHLSLEVQLPPLWVQCSS